MPSSARLPLACIVPVLDKLPADSETLLPPTICPVLVNVPPVANDRSPAFWIVPLLVMPWLALSTTLPPGTVQVPVLLMASAPSVSVPLALRLPVLVADGSKTWFSALTVRLLPARIWPLALLKLPLPPNTVKPRLPVSGLWPVRSPANSVPPWFAARVPAVTSRRCAPAISPYALSSAPVTVASTVWPPMVPRFVRLPTLNAAVLPAIVPALMTVPPPTLRACTAAVTPWLTMVAPLNETFVPVLFPDRVSARVAAASSLPFTALPLPVAAAPIVTSLPRSVASPPIHVRSLTFAEPPAATPRLPPTSVLPDMVTSCAPLTVALPRLVSAPLTVADPPAAVSVVLPPLDRLPATTALPPAPMSAAPSLVRAPWIATLPCVARMRVSPALCARPPTVTSREAVSVRPALLPISPLVLILPFCAVTFSAPVDSTCPPSTASVPAVTVSVPGDTTLPLVVTLPVTPVSATLPAVLPAAPRIVRLRCDARSRSPADTALPSIRVSRAACNRIAPGDVTSPPSRISPRPSCPAALTSTVAPLTAPPTSTLAPASSVTASAAFTPPAPLIAPPAVTVSARPDSSVPPSVTSPPA
ncbi:hypothetical protein D3C87_1115260 [compost metagenome]